MFTSRRSLLAGVGGVSLGAAANALQPRQASAGEAALQVASEGGEELVAVAVNDALEGAYGRHEGKRRNHTKGLGAVGYFVGTNNRVGKEALRPSHHEGHREVPRSETGRSAETASSSAARRPSTWWARRPRKSPS